MEFKVGDVVAFRSYNYTVKEIKKHAKCCPECEGTQELYTYQNDAYINDDVDFPTVEILRDYSSNG